MEYILPLIFSSLDPGDTSNLATSTKQALSQMVGVSLVTDINRRQKISSTQYSESLISFTVEEIGGKTGSLQGSSSCGCHC